MDAFSANESSIPLDMDEDAPLDMDLMDVLSARRMAIPLDMQDVLDNDGDDWDDPPKKPEKKRAKAEKRASKPLDMDDMDTEPSSIKPARRNIMSRAGSRRSKTLLDLDQVLEEDFIQELPPAPTQPISSPTPLPPLIAPLPPPLSSTAFVSSNSGSNLNYYSYDASAPRNGPPSPGEYGSTGVSSQFRQSDAMNVDYTIYIDVQSNYSNNSVSSISLPPSGILLSKEQVDQELANLQSLVDAGFLLPEQLESRRSELQISSKQLPSVIVPHVDYDRFLNKVSSKRNSNSKTNRNVRVFVSSTFRDMTNEREALLKDAFPKLRAICAERGVYLTSVDLRWGITTEQSDEGNTIDICLSEIERCKPYFLGILGHRYGWSHGEIKSDALLSKTFKKAGVKFPWVMQYQDRSVTELEVRQATLNIVNPPVSLTGASNFDAESAKNVLSHALFYFKDGPVLSLPDNPAKLDALKKEIVAAGLSVKKYISSQELSSLVVEQMAQMIEADFPLSEAPTPLERERQAHIAFQDVRARVYIGRQDYFTAINAHLEHTSFTSTGGHQPATPVVVLGGSGLGKSALMANWVVRWQESHPSELIIAHYIGSSALSTDLGRLLQRVMHEIKEHFGLQKEVPQKLSDLVQVFPEFLFAASNHGGVTIMLDALNQLEDKDNAHTLYWLPSKYPTNVKVVLSTLPGKCQDVLMARGWSNLTVTPMNQNERRLMVSEYMKQYGKSLTNDQLEIIVQAPQCQSPLFVRTLLEELRVFGVFEHLEQRIRHYLTAPSPPALFELVFARLEQDFETQSPGLVKNVLSLLYVSRRGLTEYELLSILNIPAATWSPLYLALEESLISKSGYFSFFHDYMRQAVATKYLKQDENSYRTKIWHYFNRAPPDDKQANERRLEEVPFQLLQQKDWSHLAGFVTTVKDFANMYTTSEDYKFDLVKYWRECVDKIDIVSAFVKSVTASGSNPTIELAIKFLQDVAAYEPADKLCRLLVSNVTLTAGKDAPASIEVAQAKATLAYLLRLRGLYKDASVIFEEVLAVLEPAFQGKASEQLGTIYNNTAELYRHQGRYPDSGVMFEKALAMRKRIYGNTSVEIAQTLDLYGVLKQDMGQYDDARRIFMESLRMREDLLGVTHPDVGGSLRNIADLCMIMNKYEEAEPMYEKAKAIIEGVFGSAHPMVQQIINSQAAMLQERGRYDDAKNLYTTCLLNQEQALGPEHALVALTLNDLGVLLIRQKEYVEATTALTRALAIRKKVFGSTASHPDIASTLQNFGALNRELRKYPVALTYFEEAHDILVKNFGKAHADVINALKQIAAIHLLLNNLDKASVMYAEALSILPTILGEMTLDVAVLCNDYAILEFKRNNHPAAERLYLRALKIYFDRLGEVHPDTAQAQYNIGEFYFRTNQKQKAIPYYERALVTFRSLHGPSHQKVQNILSRLA